CPRCGLDTARADARDAQPPALLSEAWKGLVADWKRPDAHAALTRLAERLDLLEPLGRLYQGYLETRPEDRLAKQARHEVGQLMALGAARPSPSGTHAAMA
ncbi:MAG TPA: hypothetical protein VND93_12065, partial [Myxococcales bacterium]|nr:hypothetical protein [Myxococcales bacterium]